MLLARSMKLGRPASQQRAPAPASRSVGLRRLIAAGALNGGGDKGGGLKVADSPLSSFDTLSSAKTRRRPAFLEADLCRLYYFSKDQLDVFKHLVESMKSCRTALAALATSNILLSVVAASGHEAEHAAHVSASVTPLVVSGSGLTIGDVAYWADSLMVAFLISYAIGPFERVMSSRSNQMARAFQGVNRLALIFQQLSIGSVAVSTVTALEAAAMYPPLVVGTSALFFFVALVRSGAMWWTISRHTTNNEEISRTLEAIRDPEHSSYARQMSLLDRWAVFLSFGYLLQYETKETQLAAAAAAATASDGNGNGSGSGVADGGALCYEFSLAEERVLRSLTEAASTAGLALTLQAFVTLMLTVANYGVNDLPEMVSNGINTVNKGLLAALLFTASATYDRALHTCGSNDVEHLMEGLGEKGLTGTFNMLAVLSWAVTLASLAGLLLPFIEEDLLARAVGDGLSHRTAEAIVEVLEYARALLRGL